MCEPARWQGSRLTNSGKLELYGSTGVTTVEPMFSISTPLLYKLFGFPLHRGGNKLLIVLFDTHTA